MVNNFSKDIQNMSEVEFPQGLHGRIMRQLFFIRFRNNFLLIGIFLLSNALISGWYLWVKVIDSEIISIMGALMQGFELSQEFISNLLITLFNFFPFASAFIFLINLLAISYLTYLYLKFKTFPILKVE